MTSKTFEQILLNRRQFSQGLMTLMGLEALLVPNRELLGKTG